MIGRLVRLVPEQAETETTMDGKASWADDVEVEEERSPLPVPQVTQNEDGTKSVISFRFSEQGKLIRTTRKIRITTKQETVPPAIAERKKWAKFGAEKGHAAGPDLTTTTIGENVPFRLSPAYNKLQHQQQQQQQQDGDGDGSQSMKSKLADKKVSCRICKGEHFTARCPYRDTMPALDDLGDGPPNAGLSAVQESSTTGKYVPVHLRAGGGGAGAGDKMSFRERDDLSTLRVTNLSEDTMEEDLRAIFGKYGGLSRVFLAKDKDTGRVKGFAFVSFYDRSNALRAAEKLDGYGFLNLILRVELAKRQ